MSETIYAFSVPSLSGDLISLETYKGKILLVVNTASKGQGKHELAELQKIQDSFDASQFSVLSFPCSQFLNRESKHITKIQKRYQKFTFPVFAPTKVNGENTSPLFAWLKSKAPSQLGTTIEWNFTKFLIASDGVTVTRFSTTTTTQKIIATIQGLLPTTNPE